MRLDKDQFLSRFKSLQSRRFNWETHWQEIADFCIPRKNEITIDRHPGEKRNIVELFDSTAIQSAELLAGALHGMLTNPATLWFELTTGDQATDDLDGVRNWLQETSTDIMNVFNNSNFQTEIHETYLDLVTFGTATLFIEEDDDRIVSFSARHMSEVHIDENAAGTINEIFRKFKWSARKIAETFGPDAAGKEVADAIMKDPSKEFTIIHGIYPLKVHEEEKIPGNLKRFKFISQWLLQESGEIISEGGFLELPFIVSRWTKGSGEIYGRSPAMKVLPDIKMINKMDETVLKGAQKTVDPPLQVSDDGVMLPLDTTPGGLNYVRPGADPIRPFLNDARIDFGFQVLSERRARIREGFFIDQLQLNQGPQMTATEVLQRTEEKMRLLGPMLGRQQNELLRPLIDRTMAIMVRKGLIRPQPDILKEKGVEKLDVQYASTIARAQRVADAQNITRAIELAAPFMQADPTVLDNINGDEALRVIMRIFGVSQRLIRDKKERDQIRADRAKVQQDQAEQQEAQANADVVQKVSSISKFGG